MLPLPVASDSHDVLRTATACSTPSSRCRSGQAWRPAPDALARGPGRHAAGIDLRVKPGDAVKKGDVLFTMHTNEPARFERALEALEGAYSIGSTPPAPAPLIAGRID